MGFNSGFKGLIRLRVR